MVVLLLTSRLLSGFFSMFDFGPAFFDFDHNIVYFHRPCSCDSSHKHPVRRGRATINVFHHGCFDNGEDANDGNVYYGSAPSCLSVSNLVVRVSVAVKVTENFNRFCMFLGFCGLAFMFQGCYEIELSDGCFGTSRYIALEMWKRRCLLFDRNTALFFESQARGNLIWRTSGAPSSGSTLHAGRLSRHCWRVQVFHLI